MVLLLGLAPVTSAQTPESEQVRQLLNTNACVGCDLRSANLQNLDLGNANLLETVLDSADLTDANQCNTRIPSRPAYRQDC
ncbi:pentapeptide repeat-containing protein [Microcoleus sp. FACHB-1515]|nr:pentapeptide repeat-containing protein [Microcoleus sp. FACHB-1515]